MTEFILVCSNCGNRLVLEKGIDYDKISEKFNIVISDQKEINIICNGENCNNKIKI